METVSLSIFGVLCDFFFLKGCFDFNQKGRENKEKRREGRRERERKKGRKEEEKNEGRISSTVVLHCQIIGALPLKSRV